MTLSRISTFVQLKKFLQPLKKLYSTLEGRWEPDLDEGSFLLKLIEFFEPYNYYFGQLDESGEVVYFAALLSEERTKAIFWLFYVNKNHWPETKPLLFDMLDYMVKEGYETVYSRTGRTEKSYERWLSKFGAKKHEVVYKFILKDIKK